MLKARLTNLILRAKTGGWKVWLVLALVLAGVALVLKLVLTPRPKGGSGGAPGERATDEAQEAAGRLEVHIKATRDRIRQAEAELESRREELDEIKAEPDKAEKLRRLAELSNRQARRP